MELRAIHNGNNLTFRMPKDWTHKENGAQVSLSPATGTTMIIATAYTVEMDVRDETEGFMAGTLLDFADQVGIQINKYSDISLTGDGKAELWVEGKTGDGMYVKLRLVLSWPQFFIAAYLAPYWKPLAAREADIVMESMCFIDDCAAGGRGLEEAVSG